MGIPINVDDVTMKTRYGWLLDDVADGNIQPAEFKERLTILEKTKNVQEVVENKVGTEAYRGNDFGNPMYSRNYAVGDYNITYTPPETGVKHKNISDDYISISGKKMPQEVNSFSPKQTVDVEGAERKFIPAASKTEKQRLPVTRPRADQDSERKLFAHILKELEKLSGKKLVEGGKYQGQGFSGEINITSQMKPCISCDSLIKIELFNMFGNDIKINVKYGVDFKLEE